MSEHQHNYSYGPPKGGWPDFDKDGTRIKDEPAPEKTEDET